MFFSEFSLIRSLPVMMLSEPFENFTFCDYFFADAVLSPRQAQGTAYDQTTPKPGS
ncbi:Uncharacterized protein dnm_064290 [Desulfonema magnum]|uniref:Uncharacterized protein n=1 Tax=Desulfonema magnum TaxID=45655 RepID=A0A975BRP5_9BACT|nr:Uncharacterized protein dnm_064290 [Desulfonema magnum]